MLMIMLYHHDVYNYGCVCNYGSEEISTVFNQRKSAKKLNKTSVPTCTPHPAPEFHARDAVPMRLDHILCKYSL